MVRLIDIHRNYIKCEHLISLFVRQRANIERDLEIISEGSSDSTVDREFVLVQSRN